MTGNFRQAKWRDRERREGADCWDRLLKGAGDLSSFCILKSELEASPDDFGETQSSRLN